MTDIPVNSMTVADQIIQVLDALCAKFGIAVQWSSENVVPYVKILMEKYIRYSLVSTIVEWAIWAGVLLVFCFAFVYSLKKYFYYNELYCAGKDFSGKDGLWEAASIGIGIVGFTPLIIFVICTAIGVGRIIKILTFPEMYVFESLKGILASGG